MLANLPALLRLPLGSRAACQAGGEGGPASPMSSLGSPQVWKEAFERERGVRAPPGCPQSFPAAPPSFPPQAPGEPSDLQPGRSCCGSCEGLYRDPPTGAGRREHRREPPGKHAMARKCASVSFSQCLPRESLNSFLTKAWVFSAAEKNRLKKKSSFHYVWI